MFKSKGVTIFIFGLLIGLSFGAEAIAEIFLDDIEDCNVPSPDDGDVLTYDSATANWTAEPSTGNGVSELDDLIDCNVPTPNNNEVLTYNTTTANWTAETPTGNDISVLDDLTDVDTDGVSDNDFLKYRGGDWYNFSLFNTANTWLQTNTFNQDVNIGNDCTATNFIGDGSQLINLPIPDELWNRADNVLYTTTDNDNVQVNATLIVDKINLRNETKSWDMYTNETGVIIWEWV